MSTSWWSRRSGPKPIVTDLPPNHYCPPSSSAASSASVASPYDASSPHHSRGSGAAQPRAGVPSAHPTSSYAPLATSLAPSNRSNNMRKPSKDSHIKIVHPPSVLSSGSSSTFGNFFGIGGGGSRSRKLSEAGYSINGGDNTTDASSISTNPKSSSRNRAYTLSTSTTSTRWPITPISTDGDFQQNTVRTRSDSTTSALSRRVGSQLPSLLSVEEYDPFASNTNSFNVLPTPPPLTPDSQSFGDLLNSTFKLPPTSPLKDEYFDGRTYGGGERPGKDSSRLLVQPLNLSRRPSAPPLKTSSTLASPATHEPGPNSAGPFTKKPMPLLPFRSSKQTKEKKLPEPVSEKSETASRFGNLLRPRAATPSSRMSTHSTDSSGRSGTLSSLGTRQPLQPTTAPTSPSFLFVNEQSSHHAVSTKSSQSDLTNLTRKHSVQRHPLSHQSSSQSLAPTPSPVRDTSKRRGVFLSVKPFAETTTAVTMPPATIQLTSPHSSTRRPRPVSNQSNSSNDSLKGRLRASLAVTVHEMDDMIMGTTKAGGIDLEMELDSELGHMAVNSLARETETEALDIEERDSVVEIILPPTDSNDIPRAKVSPILCERGEETGAFELLLPPKPGGDGHSPSSALSSSAEKYFISPYPSGMPVVGSFDSEEARESSDDEGGMIPLPTPACVVERGTEFMIEPLPKEERKKPVVVPLKLVGSSKSHDISMVEPRAAMTPEPKSEAAPQPVVLHRARGALEMIQDAIVNAAAATSQVLLHPMSSHDDPSTPTPTATTTPLLRHGTSAMPLMRGSSSHLHTHNADSSPNTSPQHPSRLYIPSKPSLTSSQSNSSTTSLRSPLTPMHFRSNPVMNNIAASTSQVSFTSTKSGKSPYALDKVEDEDEEDELSDLDQSFVTSRSSIRKRRGSEPASTKSRMDPALGTSFGVQNFGSMMSGTSPPSPSIPVPTKHRKWSRDTTSPSPPSGKMGSPNAGRGRNHTSSGPPSALAMLGTSSMQSFMRAMASSTAAGSISEDGGASVYSAKTTTMGPKRQKSFTHQLNAPPIPLLRHFSSFTATKAPSTLGMGPGHLSSPGSPVIGPIGGSAKSESGHQATPSRRKAAGRESKTSSQGTVGPKGETMDGEPEWAQERSRYVKDDDAKSLAVTLNRFTLTDRHSLEGDGGPSTSLTDSVASSPSAKSPARKGRSTSPVRSDYSMHILPPSQLLRVGEIFDGDSKHANRDRDLAELAEEDDLLHGDFEDMGSVLDEAGGPTWGMESLLREPSPLPVTFGNRTTTPMMAIFEGRQSSSRPFTSDSTSSNRSHGFGMTPFRRPSISQGSVTTSGGRGGPLSPPPARSRLPRSSISSSTRSIPGSNASPLTPAPRTRAISNTDTGSVDRRSTAQSTIASTGSRSIQTVASGGPSPRNSLRSPSNPGVKAVNSQDQVVAPPKKPLSTLDKTRGMMKRQTLKPSFLDIDFDDEADEPEEAQVGRHESKPSWVGSNRTLRGMSNGLISDKMQRLKRESLSFLDLDRGSMDSIRD
ncbi:hypothetical protein FRB96_000748 [Tulasnella sp. 330]|nr:hypothetical protein FRB96_000748 [Tulasnella sp. 330]KAG8873571.1 hypothetical protein FRB97_006642 [Tulasnella sp. 331]